MRSLLRIRVFGEKAERLQVEARLRGMTPTELVNRLLQVILDDRIIDAVLDDAPLREVRP